MTDHRLLRSAGTSIATAETPASVRGKGPRDLGDGTTCSRPSCDGRGIVQRLPGLTAEISGVGAQGGENPPGTAAVLRLAEQGQQHMLGFDLLFAPVPGQGRGRLDHRAGLLTVGEVRSQLRHRPGPGKSDDSLPGRRQRYFPLARRQPEHTRPDAKEAKE